MDNKPSVFSMLGPSKSFALGIIATFLVIFTVGFFILLFSDGGFNLGSKTDSKSLAAFNQPADSGSADTTGGSEAGQINIKPVSTDDHIRGDVDTAQVIVVEFSDTECPFCKRFHPTMQQVVDDYDGKVAWVYRHFPLDSLHPKARKEAEATECAAELGGNEGFWAYIDRLFEVTPANNGLDPAQLPQIAQAVGLDVNEFQTCLDSGKYKDKIEAQYQDAVTSGGRGTPYSVVITRDGQKIPMSGALPIAQVKALLNPLVK